MSDRQPLTEQQILPDAQAYGPASPSLRRAFDEARAAHIAIDLQRCYCEPGHSYYISPALAQKAAALAGPVSDFADTMRGIGLRTVWVAHAFNGAVKNRSDYKPTAYRERVRMVKNELYNVRRDKTDLLLCKDHFDAFDETQLDRMLKKRGIRTLLLTGAFFDQCVYQTARTAVEKGYKTFVVRDLTVPTSSHIAHIEKNYQRNGVAFVNGSDVERMARHGF